MKTKLLKITIAALFAGVACSAQAATDTEDLAISANVKQSCIITTTPVTFVDYDPVVTHAAAPLDAQGAVQLNCTKKSTSVSVGLGLGTHASGSTRRMVHAVTATEFLTYELYQPSAATHQAACARTTVWGNTVGTDTLAIAAATLDGTSREFFVCGRVPQAQNIEVGNYSDTVVATVNF